jgi:glucose/arabinose dehydrogenase
MVRFSPDGWMVVSVGSSCDDCAEGTHLERGTLIRYSTDGTTREVMANGLRNTIGFVWDPRTGVLWAWTTGRTSGQ